MAESPLDLSIIVISWNVSALLRECLRSIPEAAHGLTYELIVIDNASTDGSPDMVEREFPAAHVIRSERNTGFAGGNNQAIRQTDPNSRYILLLNSDTLVPPGALREMIRFLDDHPQAGAASPRLQRPDGAPQPFAFGSDPTLPYLIARGISQNLLRRYLHDWNTTAVQSVDWVSGACLIVRRQAIERAGLLDENMFMYFEDAEWCLRIRKCGWKVYYVPTVSITHIGGQSLAQNPAARRAYYQSMEYLYAKHYGRVQSLLLRLALMPYRLVKGG